MSLCCSAAVFGADARSQDTWRRPHPGMRHLHRRLGFTDFHLVMVDLGTPGLRFVSTDEDALAPRSPGAPMRWKTTSQFARGVGAELAINANYYDIRHGAMSVCGLAMARGRPWGSAYTDRRLGCWESAGFGPGGRVEFFDSHERTFGPAPERWMREVVTGSPRVLSGGEVVDALGPRHARSRNPRTIIGLSRERDTFFVMLVNGREGRNLGMTTADAGRALREFGAWDALNLDGGGSSTLYLRGGRGVVNHLADGSERAVGNHLGIVFDPPGSVVDEPVEETPRLASAPEIPSAADPAGPVVVAPSIPPRARVAASPTNAGLAQGRWSGAAIALVAAVSWAVRRRSLRPPSRAFRP